MLPPVLTKNDARAKWLIGLFSVIVFAVVTVLGRYNLAGQVTLPFDVHLFAAINATINATVSVLLLAGLVTIRQRKYLLHKQLMMTAMVLSVLFLLSYIGHHLLAGETMYGETDGIPGLSEAEKAATGSMRTIYLVILLTHIPLAGLALPFILFAAYRALTGEYQQHRKLVKWVWPVWFYVAITGVIVYFMISPYYS